ncbi:hypothetical protein Tco_0989653 [Tanacetum coccineum]|uniref:Uncharacterized protein n=1 Tax=Tanacetum coccineum TaxID=301880 RepID=A0ABQ5EUR3_9ASTR
MLSDIVRDVLYDICRRVVISTKKEAPVNFLTNPSDGRSALRLADVFIFGWVERKHACVNLTGVSPLVGLSSWGFTVGQTALKAALCKVTKHEKTCIENQHVSVPFAFDTFCFLPSEVFIDIHVHLQDAGVGGGVSPTGAKEREDTSEKLLFTRIGNDRKDERNDGNDRRRDDIQTQGRGRGRFAVTVGSNH